MSDDEQTGAQDALRARAEVAMEICLWLVVMVGTVGAWWLPTGRCLGSAGTAFLLLAAWSDGLAPARARMAHGVRDVVAGVRRVPGAVRVRVSSARSGWSTIGRAA